MLRSNLIRLSDLAFDACTPVGIPTGEIKGLYLSILSLSERSVLFSFFPIGRRFFRRRGGLCYDFMIHTRISSHIKRTGSE